MENSKTASKLLVLHVMTGDKTCLPLNLEHNPEFWIICSDHVVLLSCTTQPWNA
jgi:hypothetical protein